MRLSVLGNARVAHRTTSSRGVGVRKNNGKGRMRCGLAVVVGALLAACCWAPVSASAGAVPDLLWKAPEDGQPGGEAGRFRLPFGVAADPQTGHVFIADRMNARIVELTVWGEFVKAWGWGVVQTGPNNKPAKNEAQALTVSASGGSYRLTYVNVYRSGDEVQQTTVPINYNWPAADPGTPEVIDSVQEAIADLTSLKPFPGSVVVTGGPGDVGGSTPYEIEFVGQYADKDIPPLVVTDSGLAGGSGASVSETRRGGSFEICMPVDGDICQEGQGGGNAPGEMPGLIGGIALDEADNLYVYEAVPEDRGEGRSYRVQKFSAAGEFVAMWGGEVNKTKAAEAGSTDAERNLCTQAQIDAGDVCGTGVPGGGDGQFQHTFSVGARIAVGPTGSVSVGDVGRIQEFSAAGSFVAELAVPGETVQAMAVDDVGDVYAVFAGSDDVRKLTAAGGALTEVMAFPASDPDAPTIDGSGNVYIIEGGQSRKVIAYEADGSPLITAAEKFAQNGNALVGLATTEACEIPGVDIYVSDFGHSISAYGPAPMDVDDCPPPLVVPRIGRQFATRVGIESATVRATINPQFWPDTRYYVEYGTSPCASGGCAAKEPLPPGELLTGQVVKQLLRTKEIELGGLLPQTTYHYRFVAESTGGGPVYGVDPDGQGVQGASFAEGLEGTFRTRRVEKATSCPNSSFRVEVDHLPDCRAYEMVSPVDKENGDIIVLEKGGIAHAPLSLNQSSPDGDRLTYSSYRAFGDAKSSPITSAYMATRGAAGWSSHGLSPSRGLNTWEIATSIDTQFKAFSADLCDSWLVSETEPPLAPGAPDGYANLYRRDNCNGGGYEALIGTTPESLAPVAFRPELQGVSGNGERTIFRVNDKLTDDSLGCVVPGDLNTCKRQLYETLGNGELRFVCILPGAVAAPAGCSAGSASGGIQNDGRSQMVDNAISADGSRIFWSDAANGLGRIYARIAGTLTVPVSEAGEELSGTSDSQYWTAADDGSMVVYSTGALNGSADLYKFDVAGNVTELIAGKLYGLVGASADATQIYLVSAEVLAGAAGAGEPNLYLYDAEAETFKFIATLSIADANVSDGVPYSPVNLVPRNHVAQVSADGAHAVFMSTASLTGFDNTDAESDEPDAEVFRYDADAEQLLCISCNATGALPTGRDIGGDGNSYWAAAQIPISQTQLYQAPRVMTPDGDRVYFESFEPLAASDTNAMKDVYQWTAVGEGYSSDVCDEGSATYNDEAHGCVSLISTGASDEDSSLIEVSPDGVDVFFATADSLVPQDPGLVDIYDARANGGFPSPQQPGAFCEGGACQASPGQPPQAAPPTSATFTGPGNPKYKSKTARCGKGKRAMKVRGKKRCVKVKNPSRRGAKSRCGNGQRVRSTKRCVKVRNKNGARASVSHGDPAEEIGR